MRVVRVRVDHLLPARNPYPVCGYHGYQWVQTGTIPLSDMLSSRDSRDPFSCSLLPWAFPLVPFDQPEPDSLHVHQLVSFSCTAAAVIRNAPSVTLHWGPCRSHRRRLYRPCHRDVRMFIFFPSPSLAPFLLLPSGFLIARQSLELTNTGPVRTVCYNVLTLVIRSSAALQPWGNDDFSRVPLGSCNTSRTVTPHILL